MRIWAGVLLLVTLLTFGVPAVTAQPVQLNSTTNTTTVDAGDSFRINSSFDASDARYEGPGLNLTTPSGWTVATLDDENASQKDTGDHTKWVWLDRGVKNVTTDVTVPVDELNGSYDVHVVASAVNTTPAPNQREIDAESHTIHVNGNYPPNADIDYSPTNPGVGEQVSFSGGNTTDDGSIATYSWNLGDGTTAVGENVTHTYSSGGDFTVTLTVTDNLGATDTESLSVSVEEPVSSPTNTAAPIGGGGGYSPPPTTVTSPEETEPEEPDSDEPDDETDDGDGGDEPEFNFTITVDRRQVSVSDSGEVAGTATVIQQPSPDIGETVTVYSTVTNVGDVEGSTVAQLNLEGEALDSTEITLSSGESRNVSFDVAFSDPGSYRVRVGASDNATVNVTSPEGDTTPVYAWGLLAAMVLLISLVLLRQLRRSQQEGPTE